MNAIIKEEAQRKEEEVRRKAMVVGRRSDEGQSSKDIQN
jgi:hypothetical protein